MTLSHPNLIQETFRISWPRSCIRITYKVVTAQNPQLASCLRDQLASLEKLTSQSELIRRTGHRSFVDLFNGMHGRMFLF